MQVRVGWSGETRSNVWEKTDVTLGEEDLQRMLSTAGLPADGSAALDTKVCFQLLKNEGEFLLLVKLKDLGYPAEKANTRMIDIAAQNQAILDALRGKVNKQLVAA